MTTQAPQMPEPAVTHCRHGEPMLMSPLFTAAQLEAHAASVAAAWKDYAEQAVREAVDAERERLRSELETYRADAERYRLLRDRLLAADFDYGGDGTEALVFEMPTGCAVSANCDATIDAAIDALQRSPHV